MQVLPDKDQLRRMEISAKEDLRSRLSEYKSEMSGFQKRYPSDTVKGIKGYSFPALSFLQVHHRLSYMFFIEFNLLNRSTEANMISQQRYLKELRPLST